MVLPPVTLLCKISFRLAHWNRISELTGFMYILHGNLECGMEDLWSKASELNCFFVCLMARPYTLQEFHHAFLSMLLGTWTRFLLQYGALGSSAGSQSAIFGNWPVTLEGCILRTGLFRLLKCFSCLCMGLYVPSL